MKLLLDTHVLLWAASHPEKISLSARQQISDTNNEPLFSVASIWELTIKRMLGRKDFAVDPRQLRRGLLDNGFVELPITSAHVLAVDALPPIHKDPFDRILLAQAVSEGILLLTADPIVAQYPAPVHRI